MKKEIVKLNAVDPHHTAELLLLARWVICGPFVEMDKRVAFVSAEYLMGAEDKAAFLAMIWQLNAEMVARR